MLARTWKRIVLLQILLLLLSGVASGNDDFHPRFSIGLKYTGLSIHLKKSEHPQLYRHNIDKAGYGVLTHGFIINLEYFLHNDLALRVSQGLVFFDCAGKFHGATQIALSHGYRPTNSAHEFRVAAGPILFYRKSWKSLPGYVEDGLFKESPNKVWQSKFVWHGAEIEYNYWQSPTTAFSLNWLPGVPEIFTFSPGIKMLSE